ncbi:hypothetical protein TUM4438_25840 [Shewanella sairae]|uniref:Uncharacterized protein n=1 Tax=Shewanella sairae TaxID=190310 RepID=A0ABQ4PI84_9GAMM|nr:hypothetical protein [Shewanella sairae]MCL1131594.1 hypothetical protein [Shewanella sairae]GIU47255.1 hypothetical protein TUM4438_25840 [Shewanella sairae]
MKNEIHFEVSNKITVTNRLLSVSYLLLSWSLLIWLNFNIEPNLFGHFIVIPSLGLLSGYSAYLIAVKNNKAASIS